MIGKGLKKETALEGETNSLLLVANVEELSERYECPLWHQKGGWFPKPCGCSRWRRVRRQAGDALLWENIGRFKKNIYIYSRTFTALHLWCVRWKWNSRRSEAKLRTDIGFSPADWPVLNICLPRRYCGPMRPLLDDIGTVKLKKKKWINKKHLTHFISTPVNPSRPLPPHHHHHHHVRSSDSCL